LLEEQNQQSKQTNKQTKTTENNDKPNQSIIQAGSEARQGQTKLQ
jgi:hypothetical protein